MERREFLKILGLSGVALTLPKPMGIVSARMAELKAPPLHVGYCQVGPLADEQRYFIMDRISVGSEPRISMDRAADYYEKWAVTVFSKFVIGRIARRRMLLKVTARHIPDPNRIAIDGRVDGKLFTYPMSKWRAYAFLSGESLEFWFTPGAGDDLPRFPLPKLTVMLGGHMIYRKEPQLTGMDASLGGRTMAFCMFGETKMLQLERAKAIELGLCDASEPEGLIAW